MASPDGIPRMKIAYGQRSLRAPVSYCTEGIAVQWEARVRGKPPETEEEYLAGCLAMLARSGGGPFPFPPASPEPSDGGHEEEINVVEPTVKPQTQEESSGTPPTSGETSKPGAAEVHEDLQGHKRKQCEDVVGHGDHHSGGDVNAATPIKRTRSKSRAPA